MSKKHDAPATGSEPNEYDHVIVDRDREFAELIRLGQGNGEARDLPAQRDQRRCGQLAPVAGFAATVSARLQQRRAGVVLRPATEEDCVALSAALRQADREEASALSGKNPVEAMKRNLHTSSYAVTAVDADGRIICMVGVGSVGLMSDDGCPWVYGSDLMSAHWRLFARLSKQHLERMLDQYPWLSGHVDRRRAASVRFLEWLGFFVGTVETKTGGLTFRPFNLRRDE